MNDKKKNLFITQVSKTIDLFSSYNIHVRKEESLNNHILTLLFHHSFALFFSMKLSILDQKSVLTCAMWARSYYLLESVFKLQALYSKMVLKLLNFHAKSQIRVRIVLKRYLYHFIILFILCIQWKPDITVLKGLGNFGC